MDCPPFCGQPISRHTGGKTADNDTSRSLGVPEKELQITAKLPPNYLYPVGGGGGQMAWRPMGDGVHQPDTATPRRRDPGKAPAQPGSVNGHPRACACRVARSINGPTCKGCNSP